MTAHTSKDPLHGVTLEMQVNALVEKYGWVKLSQLIRINCFKNDPSVKFYRQTPILRPPVHLCAEYSHNRRFCRYIHPMSGC
ncbi:VF530 family DNA-binding protein [Morganella morganii]|nr:VF530 family DNA-binding protein [Morganella morganii]